MNRQLSTAVDLLNLNEFDNVPADPHLWGFGGLHGGMSVALAAKATQRNAPGMALRSITAHYHRPVREPFTISTQAIKVGRTAGAVTAQTSTPEGICVTSTAIYGLDQGDGMPLLTPTRPDVPPHEDCETFTPPAELVPFAGQVDIRPTSKNLPFTSGLDAELTAWIRIRTDDLPPTPERILFLFDALAPSYGVILNAPRPIPTLELSVHLTDNTIPYPSPWILLSARTDIASAGGWSTEHLDMWDSAGQHLGTSQQLRLTPDLRH